jgi:hypothetical protein
MYEDLTTEQLNTLRRKARDAIFSANYGRFGTYFNAEEVLKNVDKEKATRNSKESTYAPTED